MPKALRSFSEVSHLSSYTPALPKISEVLSNESDKNADAPTPCIPAHPLCTQEELSVLNIPAHAHVSVTDVLVRVCKYAKCSPSVFIALALMVDRVRQVFGITIHPDNVHQVVMGCFVLVVKMLDDVPYHNKVYARIAGYDTERLNAIERVLLKGMDWDVYIDSDAFSMYRAELLGEPLPTPPVAPEVPVKTVQFSPLVVPAPEPRGAWVESFRSVASGADISRSSSLGTTSLGYTEDRPLSRSVSFSSQKSSPSLLRRMRSKASLLSQAFGKLRVASDSPKMSPTGWLKRTSTLRKATTSTSNSSSNLNMNMNMSSAALKSARASAIQN
eukprot:TRINITY_DN27777_c0_g1_i1.p1 TRINITY_DN27777_c0_g1~~TRINITY_DN27777_c0_g1_i1.p1  ORF type:complete len:330 (+),score=86.31 TRINITY_DN27777_c0_g1_i1:62-1051(+)